MDYWFDLGWWEIFLYWMFLNILPIVFWIIDGPTKERLLRWKGTIIISYVILNLFFMFLLIIYLRFGLFLFFPFYP